MANKRDLTTEDGKKYTAKINRLDKLVKDVSAQVDRNAQRLDEIERTAAEIEARIKNLEVAFNTHQ